MASGGGFATCLAGGPTLKMPIANRPRITNPPHIARGDLCGIDAQGAKLFFNGGTAFRRGSLANLLKILLDVGLE